MISCDEYDYIEIVCLYRYPVMLTLKTGTVIEGIASDTGRNDARAECIKVIVDGAENLVPLDNIAELEVGIENPHFSKVVFS